MTRILVTIFFGAIFAAATTAVVALYWLMMVIFGVLRILTAPLYWLRREPT
jgi:hypothetical protein